MLQSFARLLRNRGSGISLVLSQRVCARFLTKTVDTSSPRTNLPSKAAALAVVPSPPLMPTRAGRAPSLPARTDGLTEFFAKPTVFKASQLIASLRKQTDYDGAVRVFRGLIDKGVAPNDVVLRAFLCDKTMRQHAASNDPDIILSIFRNLTAWAVRLEPKSATALLDALFICKESEKAKVLFARLQNDGLADHITYTAMLNGLAYSGNLDEAAKLVADGYARGVKFDSKSFSGLLAACCDHGNLHLAKGIFRDIKSRGLGDLTTYTAMISGLARAGQLGDAMELLHEGTELKIRWDSFTFCALLVACGKAGDLASGKRVHDIAKAHGADNGIEYQAALVDMLGRCGELKEARAVFDGLQRQGQAEVSSYSAMISNLARAGQRQEAMKLLEEGTARKVKWNARSFVALLVACGKDGAGGLVSGKRVHEIAIAHGAARGIEYQTALLDMWGRCGALDEAWSVFNDVRSRGLAEFKTYTAMISNLAREEHLEEAMNLLQEGTERKIAWTPFSFCALLVACGETGALPLGRDVHATAVASGVAKGVEYSNSLMDMLGRCGELKEARAVFDELQRQGQANTTSYNTMINGYSSANQPEQAFAVADLMRKAGVAADQVTYLCLLNACSHGALVSKARELLREMREGGLEPNEKVHTAMVDALARNGAAIEAEAYMLANVRDYEPAHTAILSACRFAPPTEANVQCARRVFDRALRLPGFANGTFSVAALYQLVVSVYERAGRQAEANELARERIASGFFKRPGRVIMYIGRKQLVFETDSDQLTPDPRWAEHRQLLQQLYDEEKLPRHHPFHAEDLALAEFMLHYKKNDRAFMKKKIFLMSDRCHAFFARMSKRLQRELTFRDGLNNIHQFNGGKCSCGR